MTQLIPKNDPRYFTCTSDKPYDRHKYKLIYKHKKAVTYYDWESLRAAWMEQCQLGSILRVDVVWWIQRQNCFIHNYHASESVLTQQKNSTTLNTVQSIYGKYSMSTSDNSGTNLPFTKGDQVEYEGSQWTVNFAQESYITLKHNVTGALPIVFPSDWGHIHPITK